MFRLFLLIILFSLPVRAEKFKVGVILPLSGGAADYGQSIANAISLAERDRPNLFQDTEFIYQDAGIRNMNQAVSAFYKLINTDRVNLVYTFGVVFCAALSPLAEERKIPFVGQCINGESSKNRKYVLRFMNHVDDYLKVQTQYLAEQGYKKIGLMLVEDPYLEEMYQALKRNLLPKQSLNIVDSFQVDNFDFRTSIAKIRHGDYDVIGVFLFEGQIQQYYRQAREQQINLPTFGTNFFDSLSIINSAKGQMDGAVFANNFPKAEFVERYQQQFKNSSQIGFAALAYEFAILTGELFDNHSFELSPKEIISRFTTVKKRAGYAAGPYTFKDTPDAGKYFEFPVVIKEIQGGKVKVH